MFTENTKKENKNGLLISDSQIDEMPSGDQGAESPTTAKKGEKEKASTAGNMNQQMQEEEDRIRKIRECKEMKRSYISSISAKFNPDLLVGQAFEDDFDDDEINPEVGFGISSLRSIILNKR